MLELLVPAALAFYFTVHRQTTGVAFAVFFFFENFLYISVYVGDARAQALPLITVGDPEAGGHDWFLILSHLGLLPYDTLLARMVRALGWLGMLGAMSWLAWPTSVFAVFH